MPAMFTSASFAYNDNNGTYNDSIDNITSSGGGGGAQSKPWLIELLSQIYLIALPVICLSGVVGNALAFFIFVSKPMRRTSCSWYLAARSVSDGGFLLTTFITWSSDASRLRFFHTNGLCQTTIFLTFVFAFLSVWMTVVVTCENFIRICRPFSVSTFCSVRIAKICIASLATLAVLMYNYPLWTSYAFIIDRDNITYRWCHTISGYESMEKVMSFWDLLITLVIPSLVIVVLMIFITASLVHSLKRQTRLQGGTGAAQRLNGNSAGETTHNRSNRSSNSPQAKVTRMLFAVSLLFILLNSPSHFIRTKMAVVDLVNGPATSRPRSPSTEEKLQVIFQIIYYLSFGVNLLIYLAFGDNFRKIFKETYLRACLRSHRRSMSNEMTALTTVRLEEHEPTRTEKQSTQQLAKTQQDENDSDQEKEDLNKNSDDDDDVVGDDDTNDNINESTNVEMNGDNSNHCNNQEKEKDLINLLSTDL